MKKLTELKKQGLQYWSGFKFLWNHPHQISHSLGVEAPMATRIANTIISRVRRPGSWLYSTTVEEVSASRCHIRVDSLEPSTRLSSLAYVVEGSIEVYLKNLIPYYFDYSVLNLEIDVNKGFRFPVDCVFSMDSADVADLLSQVKQTKRFYKDFSFEFQSKQNFCGRATAGVEISLQQLLPPAKKISSKEI